MFLDNKMSIFEEYGAFKTTELFDFALIGVCVVIRLNTISQKEAYLRHCENEQIVQGPHILVQRLYCLLDFSTYSVIIEMESKGPDQTLHMPRKHFFTWCNSHVNL